MSGDSLKRRRSACLLEAEEKYGISAGDAEKLMVQFRAVFQKLGVKQKYRIMGRLVKEKTAGGITWSDVHAALETDRKVHSIIGVIKRRMVFSRIDEIRGLAGAIDFKDYGIEDCEEPLKAAVKSSLRTGQIKNASEIVKIFGACIDFTPEIKSAYSDCAADKMNDIAEKIKEAFPEIQF